MQTLAELVKTVVPGSFPFFVAGTIAGLALWYGRGAARVWGRRWLTGLVVAYWIMSTAAGASLLEWPLRHGYRRIESRAEAGGAQAIVMLSGGTFPVRSDGAGFDVTTYSTGLRLLETLRLARLLPEARVIVSGGRAGGYELQPESIVVRDELVRRGLAASRIVVETTSRNTYEHPIHLKPILQGLGLDRFVLVTGATHLPRACRAFAAAGFSFIPSAAQTTSDRAPLPTWERWLWPSHVSLIASEYAWREYLALVYYVARRRISATMAASPWQVPNALSLPV